MPATVVCKQIKRDVCLYLLLNIDLFMKPIMESVMPQPFPTDYLAGQGGQRESGQTLFSVCLKWAG